MIMELLGRDLIRYSELLAFIKEKGKTKTWFDTLRTRYKLIHKPIIKPPELFSLLDYKSGNRERRSVFYLREITKYLENIIRLHDKDGLTYEEIKKEISEETNRLRRLREVELLDDRILKPIEFIYDFGIAKKKLKEFFNWKDNSKEMEFLNYVSKAREENGKEYFRLTKNIKEATKRSSQLEDSKLEERKQVGEKLKYLQSIMEETLKYCKKLIDENKISISQTELEEVRANVI